MIESLLSHGEENALSSGELLRATGLRSVRELRAQVEKERRQGVLILATRQHGGGYFLPSEGEKGQLEIDRFYRFFSASATSTLRTVRAMQGNAELEGQQKIGGDADGAAQDVCAVDCE